MNDPDCHRDSPLTIKSLMIWTAGVALSLTIAKLLDESNVRAWNLCVPGEQRTPGLLIGDYIAAIIYGTCLTLFLLAVRTKGFWRSPGKIILMIFASICLIDWGLSFLANTMIIQNVSVVESTTVDSVTGMATRQIERQSSSPFVTGNGFVFEIFFSNFAGTIGYALGVPILLFTLFRSRETSWSWKFVWLGFLFFNVAMLAEFYGWRRQYFPVPAWVGNYYFPCVLGVPMVAMTFAFANDLIRKNPVDWWTTLTCVLLPATWLAVVVLQVFPR